MDLKGKNLASYKKSHPREFQGVNAIQLLLQMLTSIENVHKAGLIHRDIKPVSVNFTHRISAKLSVHLLTSLCLLIV